jgi:hypothetical protein
MTWTATLKASPLLNIQYTALLSDHKCIPADSMTDLVGDGLKGFCEEVHQTPKPYKLL